MGKNYINILGGIAMMGAGIVLASPVDEAGVLITTAGLSLPSTPVQAVLTASLGSMMMLAGFHTVEKEFK